MPAIWLAQARNPASEISSINSEVFAYLKVIVSLAVILVLVVVLLRFWLPRMTGLRNLSSGPIRVAAHYPLEPRKSLYIIQAADEYFLVGTSESGVHYLTTLDSDRTGAALSQQADVSTDRQFNGLMKAFMRPRRSG